MKICKAFGWKLEYVYKFPMSHFVFIVQQLDRLDSEEAQKVVFTGHSAALNGGKSLELLLKNSGRFVSEKSYQSKDLTPVDIENAKKAAHATILKLKEQGIIKNVS